MKKNFLLFLIALCASFATSIHAYETGDVSYTYSSGASSVFVNGLSAAAATKTIIFIPGRINHGGQYYPVIINDKAFNGKTNLQTVNIEYGCKEIRTGAFYQCTNLTAVHIPSSVTTFGNIIFFGCSKLKYLNLCSEDYCRSIGTASLDGVPTSCNIQVPQSLVPSYKNSTGLDNQENWSRFNITYGGYDIFDNTNHIGYQLYSDGTAAVTRVIWNWDYGQDLKGWVIIPQTVTHDDQTFTVTAINQRAFEGNTALTNISFPSTITYFKGSAGSYSMSWTGSSDDGAQFRGCTALKAIDLPASLKSIPTECFSGSGLQNINLPYGIELIGCRAFANTPIQRLDIPSSVTEIINWEFEGMKNLKSLYLNVPASVLKYSDSANSYLDDLSSSMNLYVPVGQVNQYKAKWAKFKNTTFAGAYDFTYTAPSGNTHMGYFTVTQPANGSTQGQVKFVYYPGDGITNAQIGAIVKDKHNRSYRITALSDSCFASAGSLKSLTFASGYTGYLDKIPQSAFKNCIALTSVPFEDKRMSRLMSIENQAFYYSGISGTVNLIHAPYACAVKTMAFYNCPNINEIFCLGYNMANDAIGGTTLKAGFKCYVPTYQLAVTRNAAATWPMTGGAAKSYIYPFFTSDYVCDIISMPDGVTNPLHAMLPNATEAPNLKFYKVTGYQDRQTTKLMDKQWLTTQVNAGRSLAAGEAFLVTGIEPGKVYRMNMPSVSVTRDNDNLLYANPSNNGYAVTVDNSANYYAFDRNALKFIRQYNTQSPTFNISGGSGYLKDTGKLTEEYDADIDATSYNIRVGYTRVNHNNFANVPEATIKSGKVSYDPVTNTLTLDNVTIENKVYYGSNYIPLNLQTIGLTVNMKGTNTLNALADTEGSFHTNPLPLLVQECEDVVLTGGTLRFNGTGNNKGVIYLNSGTSADQVMFTVKDCTIEGCDILSDDYEECMTIDNANLSGNYFHAGNTVILKNCSLVKPEGGYFLYGCIWLESTGQYNGGEWIIKAGGKRGDVNGDGRVNVSDVSALINMILGITTMNETRADVNGDQKVNVSDVSALINIILDLL